MGFASHVSKMRTGCRPKFLVWSQITSVLNREVRKML
jgi:hypothetical protein